MLFDWLVREGWIVVNWWLLATVAGLTALPLLVRLLPALPDKGYTLARPAGILLVGFVFWLLAILRLVNNSPGSIVLAWVIVAGVAAGVYFTSGERFDWGAWWRENRALVVVAEVLFVVLLLTLAIYRAHQNDLTTTEKPMDLAFMSAIQRSDTFPPDDPWLSDYAISYYYFGYVIAAMFSTMAGVWSTTGYNMHLALLFALTGVATLGVTYNLVRSRARRFAKSTDEDAQPVSQQPGQSVSLLFGLLGVVFVLILSNFHTVIVEIPLQSQSVSQEYLRFWDAKDRDSYNPETQPVNFFDQEEMPYWWWFGASRTITERDLNGQRVNEVIDEFPMFSFILGDSHPHVMALPFALLAMGLALNVLLGTSNPTGRQILFYGICVGALVFLNTWDSPIYIMMLVGADAVRRLVRRGRLIITDWLEMIVLGVALLGITFVAYLPFLVGFRSQLGGVLPNLIHPTRFQQIFVMFGPFLLILAFFLALEVWRGRRVGYYNLRFGLRVALAALLILLGSFALFLAVGRFVPDIWATVQGFVTNNGGWGEVVPALLLRRLEPTRLLTTLILLLVIALVVARLFPRSGSSESESYEPEGFSPAYPPATGFALLLVGVGASLVLIPEFLYLRDNFGWRMNTVFKFYYQAWIAFGVASAYAVYTVTMDTRQPHPGGFLRAAMGVTVAVVLALGLIYPVAAGYHRMFIETNRLTAPEPPSLTLDGGQGFTYADDYAAILCLQDFVGRDEAVVAETNPQGNRVNYNPNHGRVGSLSGIPVIIGWPGHQSQWRGTNYREAVGTRQPDLDTLFTDLRFDQVEPIIERYGIDYIFYGQMERNYYGAAGEEKFQENYAAICEFGETRVYQVGSRPGIVSSE